MGDGRIQQQKISTFMQRQISCSKSEDNKAHMILSANLIRNILTKLHMNILNKLTPLLFLGQPVLRMPTDDQPVKRLVTCRDKDTGAVNGVLERGEMPHAAVDHRTVSGQ